MYTLIRKARNKQELIPEIAPMAISMIVAEVFFKFHSFTLECIAFLASWFLLSALISLIRDMGVTRIKSLLLKY